jgi:hypothetical protein
MKKIPFFLFSYFDKKLEIDECVYTRRAEIKTTTASETTSKTQPNLTLYDNLFSLAEEEEKQRKAFTKTFT